MRISFPVRCLLIVLAFSAAGASCQSAPQPPDCVGLALDMTPHFFIAPDELRVVAIDLRNPTAQACTLRPDGGPAQGPLLVLQPGETAHTSFRWTSISPGASTQEPAKIPDNCHALPNRVVAVNRGPASLLIDTPSLLPPICSEVHYDPYLPGAFVPDWPLRPSTSTSTSTTLALSASKLSYNRNEAIRFHLEASGVDDSLYRTDQLCPVLIRQTRTASGLIVLDNEAPGYSEPGRYAIRMLDRCNPHSRNLGMEVLPRTVGEPRAGEPQRQTVQYSVMAGLLPTGEVRLISSNPVAFTVQAPVPPDAWGTTVKGIRTTLKLDKTTYRLGEDIPLHIFAQVLTTKPVYTVPDVPSTYRAPEGFYLTIFDASGASVGNTQKANLWQIPLSSSGVTFCPAPVAQGTVLPLEASPSALGLLPAKPGRYQLTVSWSPYKASSPPCSATLDLRPRRRGRNVSKGKIFATATSTPVWIEITPTSEQTHSESTPPMRQ